MRKIDITRKHTSYESGRIREEFYLLAPGFVNTALGVRVPLGSRKDLVTLRDKINKYLES